MKRNGLRALGLVSCVVALFSLLSVAVDLDGIVANELIAEISIAAGMNLVDQYIADYTVEELESLAATAGLTPGQAAAVNGALYKLSEGLVPYLAVDAVTGENVYDNMGLLTEAAAGNEGAAEAFVFRNRVRFTKPEAIEVVLASGQVTLNANFDATDPASKPSYAVLDAAGVAKLVAPDNKTVVVDLSDNVIVAFGAVLGGYYGPGSPVGLKTEAELLALLDAGSSLGVSTAAATALATYWILGSELTYVDVQNAILGAMIVTPELALAYQGYLAYLYSL
jgi:hypothetical protein